MRAARVTAISSCLPDAVLTNQQLADLYSEWTAQKISDKIGIDQRHISADDETASDLAFKAAEKLFQDKGVDRKSIDYVLFCTQSPDYALPTSACLLQNRLGLRTSVGALDFNLGCSGYVYGLSLAKGLVEAGLAGRVLLLTADTYSKFIHPMDKSVRTLFGDGASATLVEATDSDEPLIGPFVFGTDGRGGEHLIVPSSGARIARSAETAREQVDASGNVRSADNLYMDGSAIMAFTLAAVPAAVSELLAASNKDKTDIDLFVFHQASEFILERLRRKIGIESHKFVIAMRGHGNTVSSSIPLALEPILMNSERPKRVMLVGFGVGLSWAATNIVI